MGWLIWAAISIAAFIGLRFFQGRSAAGRGVIIRSPTIGFFNFGGEEFSSLLNEDQAALASLFREAASADGKAIPSCDVLFLYARIAVDGSVQGGVVDSTLRHIAVQAGASILVLASNNVGAHLVAATKQVGPKQASLVLTLDRKGEDFTKFFRELFSCMKSGTTMPKAWVAIAPQHESVMPTNTPSTIFIPEAGAVSFQNSRSG